MRQLVAIALAALIAGPALAKPDGSPDHEDVVRVAHAFAEQRACEDHQAGRTTRYENEHSGSIDDANIQRLLYARLPNTLRQQTLGQYRRNWIPGANLAASKIGAFVALREFAPDIDAVAEFCAGSAAALQDCLRHRQSMPVALYFRECADDIERVQRDRK